MKDFMKKKYKRGYFITITTDLPVQILVDTKVVAEKGVIPAAHQSIASNLYFPSSVVHIPRNSLKNLLSRPELQEKEKYTTIYINTTSTHYEGFLKAHGFHLLNATFKVKFKVPSDTSIEQFDFYFNQLLSIGEFSVKKVHLTITEENLASFEYSSNAQSPFIREVKPGKYGLNLNEFNFILNYSDLQHLVTERDKVDMILVENIAYTSAAIVHNEAYYQPMNHYEGVLLKKATLFDNERNKLAEILKDDSHISKCKAISYYTELNSLSKDCMDYCSKYNLNIVDKISMF